MFVAMITECEYKHEKDEKDKYSISPLSAQLKPHSVNTVNYSTAVLLLTTFILSVSDLY